jgi:site-specific recombinase XerD
MATSTINFRTNNGRTISDYSKPQKIYFCYLYGRNVDFRASINESVLIDKNYYRNNPKWKKDDQIKDDQKSDWSFEKQRIKDRTHIHDRHAINGLIENLISHFKTFDDENRKNGIIPTRDLVKNHFEAYWQTSEPQTDDRPITFFEFVDSFIEKSKTKPSRHTANQTPVKDGTIQGYITALNLFTRYFKEVQKFDFEDIDLHFYNKFTNWCNTLNFRKGYIGKNIKTLKVFMNAAVREGVTSNTKFKDSDFVVMRETADSIYLNLDELGQMWRLDLTNEPTKERARDLFLIGCFTGLRVSDYNNLKASSIRETNGVKMLVVKTQKTSKTVAMPLHPIVEAILTKHNGIPSRMYDQKINDNIKEVARLTGLDEITETTATIGGLEVTQRQPKYKLVCTHTARRSFCTNAYLTGMDSLDIMAISGHTTDKDFRKYIKVTAEQRAVKMSQNAFFTNATALKVG